MLSTLSSVRKWVLVAGAAAVLFSASASAQRVGSDRPVFGNGESGTDGGAALVVIRCEVAQEAAPMESAPGGNCFCSSSGEGSSSCTCSSSTGGGSLVPAVAPTLVVSEVYASPDVPRDILDAISASDSCQAAVAVASGGGVARSGTGECQFSNLWYSCEL